MLLNTSKYHDAVIRWDGQEYVIKPGEKFDVKVFGVEGGPEHALEARFIGKSSGQLVRTGEETVPEEPKTPDSTPSEETTKAEPEETPVKSEKSPEKAKKGKKKGRK